MTPRDHAVAPVGLTPPRSGTMRAHIEAVDWSRTALGPMAQWPQSLRTTVDIMLATPEPASVIWGVERVQLYNDAYVAIAGERHPAALGQPVAVTWAEAYADFLGPVVERGFAGEVVLIEEHAVVLRDARGGFQERHFTGSFLPVRNEAGEVGGLLHMLAEETARVRADISLRESEARYRTLFDAIASGFCVVEVRTDGPEARLDYRVIEANPAFFEQTGFPREIVGQWLREAVPTLEEHWYERYGRVALTGESMRFEEGSAHLGRWFDVYAFRIGAPDERRVAILFNDISARRLAETQLRELNETLEHQVAERSAERDRLWNLSQDMLARADYSGMMSAVSPAWTRVLGWTETELLTRGYATFMHPDDMPPTLEAIARMGETHRPTRFENRIATSAGGWKNIEWTVAPEPDGANFIAVGRDVSLTRAQQSELAQAQEQLRQSQKMEAMGQLTGGVAHDFNNLLMPIIGSLDLLVRREVGNDRERRLIDGALQSAERARILVQRLLAFARRQPLQSTAVDLKALVGDMAGLVDSTSGPRVEVRVDLASDLPPAIADANQLEMAVLNLAVNARDAMPEGGVLTISAAKEQVGAGVRLPLPPGDYVRLSIADTGVGMDAEVRARSIEPFFSTKGIGKGTGLGLSMVHGLVSQLGGALSIDSSPGRGTTVSLILPASPANSEIEATAPTVTRSREATGTALLVDDEEVVRMTTADMLTDLGYEVVEAASGSEALRRLKEGLIPNLLVTDHLMPGLNGAELARAAKTIHPQLPILIVSGYAETDGLPPDLARLTKPFRSAELAEKLVALGVLVEF